MALDRFIYFERQIKQDVLGKVIGEFLGTWPEMPRWDRDRFIIHIEGKPANGMYREERFIEVHIGKKDVDVITRQADPLVNSIAKGLAYFIARTMEGKLGE
jgi:hypothetical protein